jgi:two-component system, OmpR family, phosphate regulon sensor histidine kinase PhoR
MPTHFATLALCAALIAITGLIITALRLQRARRNFADDVAAWKLKSSLDHQHAIAERNQLLDALSDSFILVDADAHILFANRSARKFFQARDLVGKNLRETFLDQRLAHAIIKSLDTGEHTISRVVLPQQVSPLGDNEQRGDNAWVIDSARLNESPADDPITRIVIRDVTSEHQTEQIRKDFVANASHELRTPLAIINGYLENILDDGLLDDKEMTRRFLTIMRKHTGRISRIIEDMLVISRLESGEAASLKIKPFRIRSCINDVLERLESIIRTQEASIQLTMPDDSLQIIGDRFYWTQILFNLVENALKQNPRKGLTVGIGCLSDQEKTTIWVSDDGVGIPSADLPHIFRRFYRVEKHHSQDQIKGTGLGLSIVKRAIEAHGGSIRVSSIPGIDTRFTIEIPHTAEESLKALITEDYPKIG